MTQAPTTQWLDGLASLADRYDGFVVDQFGVLHDGREPYPGAADALRRLRERGHRVIVLSNSGKRAEANAKRLARFGVTLEHCDAILTSGELTWQMLHARDRAPFATLGRRVLPCHPAEDLATLAGLDLEIADGPADADFVLLASLPDERPAEALQATLDAARARGLPLICANPDRERLTARGVEPSSGALAARYEAAGGQVTWLGKPHRLVYEACREAMERLGARRFLAIGDSLEHDVAGGAGAGYDTCYIAGGLHARAYAELGAAPWTPAQRAQAGATLAALREAPEAHGAPAPTWALPSLRW